MVAKPRWLSFVFRAVGDIGSGDGGGIIGDLIGVIGVGVTGDLNESIGLVVCVPAGTMLRESFGFMALEASILTICVLDVLRQLR